MTPPDLVDAAVESRHGSNGGQSLAAAILGNDAVVAARPHMPAQLVHACVAAGFDLVVPPSWGDEVLAGAYLDELGGRGDPVIIGCACPRVAMLLARAGATLPPRLALASPPVAAARSLRRVHGESILITYVGDCPSAADPSIDVRFAPAALFTLLERQGIAIGEQSTDLAPADAERWRRYTSVPGGLPALRFLARPPVGRVLRTMDLSDVLAGRVPSSRSRILVDLADAAQCVCGGNRDTVEEGEPPRSTTPCIIRPPGVDLGAQPSAPRRMVVAVQGPRRAPSAGAAGAPAAPPATGPADATADSPADATARSRPVAQIAAAPNSHVEGPAVTASPVASSPAAEPPTVAESSPSAPVRAAGASIPARPAGGPAGREAGARRRYALVALPLLVLAVAAALGVAVYAGSSADARRPRASVPGEDARAAARTTGRSATGEAENPVTSPPGTESSLSPAGSPMARESVGSGARDTTGAANERASVGGQAARGRGARSASVDSAGGAPPRRPRRAPAARVVPGWLPQGRPAFTPVDTGAARRADSAARPAPVRPDTSVPPT